MGIIRRCTHRYNDDDDDTSSVCTFECENKRFDLRDEINKMKYKQSLLRKSPKQHRKEKLQDKDARTVMVNNLHRTTTMEDLKKAFMDFGRIYSATLSCTFRSKDARGHGHALLEFRDIETMILACNMDGAILHSRSIRVSPKSSSTIRIIKGPVTDDGYEQRYGRGHGQNYGAGEASGRGYGHGYGRIFGRDITNIKLDTRRTDSSIRTQHHRSFLDSQVKFSAPRGMPKRV
ncbi:hypothetical protein BG000_003001 [Podila horticola]|nr:hypothetical protein BG000_003001 [Podila horticola]